MSFRSKAHYFIPRTLHNMNLTHLLDEWMDDRWQADDMVDAVSAFLPSFTRYATVLPFHTVESVAQITIHSYPFFLEFLSFVSMSFKSQTLANDWLIWNNYLKVWLTLWCSLCYRTSLMDQTEGSFLREPNPCLDFSLP